MTVVVAAGAVLVSASPAVADDISASQGYRKAVTPANIARHLTAFQSHADALGGNRVAGSAAHEASAAYVTGQLEAVGYTVTNQSFDFVFNADATPPVFQQVSPAPASYVDGVDFASMTYSPNGDVTANVVAVDLTLPPTPAPSSTSGCEASDFAGVPGRCDRDGATRHLHLRAEGRQRSGGGRRCRGRLQRRPAGADRRRGRDAEPAPDAHRTGDRHHLRHR